LKRRFYRWGVDWYKLFFAICTKWTLFWQYYISTFSRTIDYYYWYRDEKKDFLQLLKNLEKILKCRIVVPSYEKYNLRLGLTVGGAKNIFTSFYCTPS
jgi:hypothetical protein